MTDAVLARNNVKVLGAGTQPMLFAHGFGCDQNMWRYVAPAFADDYKLVLFDYVGSGHSELAAYDAERYATGVGQLARRRCVGSMHGHNCHVATRRGNMRARRAGRVIIPRPGLLRSAPRAAVCAARGAGLAGLSTTGSGYGRLHCWLEVSPHAQICTWVPEPP